MDFHPSAAAPARPAPRASDQPSYRLPLLVVILVLLVIVAFLPTYLEQLKYKQTKGEVAAINEALQDPNIASMGKLFTFLARKVSPSVVHIDTERQREMRDEMAALYGFQLPRQQGQASGVIVDEEGYILTNNHVIATANRRNIQVRLHDGRTRTAEVVGADPKNDLAVLKIEADDLVPAPWGDSALLEVGEMVWALGNPFGLDNTLTFGIVSAKDRRVRDQSRYQEYLQTDAAVNPGNSGGPLVNIMGEIVGINTAIVGPMYQGISFAIPSNVARRIYQEIREHGEVETGYLGAQLAALDARLAKQLGHDRLDGALVAGVLEDSPAAAAGLEPGDLVIGWNDEKIDDPQELIFHVARTRPGAKATLKVLRQRQTIELEVVIGKRPPEE